MLLVTGQIIHSLSLKNLEVYQNGFVIIDSAGIIKAIATIDRFESILNDLQLPKSVFKRKIILNSSQFLIPGFVDCHTHAVQYPNVGLGYDKSLIQWLDNYTYRLEREFRDLTLCGQVFGAFIRRMLDCGTTTACYFGSLFTDSTLVLVDNVVKYGQRAFIGKVNMTELAPADYTESASDCVTNTRHFIQSVLKRNSPLVKPIITPRFALSLTPDLLQELAGLAQEYQLPIQTHIAENHDEIRMVQHTFRANTSYAHVYYTSGLLTSRTVLAHGIHLSDEELSLIRQQGGSIAHCPESNTNLNSGLCNVRRLLDAGIRVGLGSDVGAGAQVSIVNVIRGAMTVSRHVAITHTEQYYEPISYKEAFHLGTLGGAQALGIDKEVGNFIVGKHFDALIIDLEPSPDYFPLVANYRPEEMLQKFLYAGDDRNVVGVFVNGGVVKNVGGW